MPTMAKLLCRECAARGPKQWGFRGFWGHLGIFRASDVGGKRV